jgi:hypothetical protein
VLLPLAALQQPAQELSLAQVAQLPVEPEQRLVQVAQQLAIAPPPAA